MSSKEKRFTIGVLVSGIMDEVTKCVCNGVLQKAKQADVNVVIFPGKYLERDLSDNRELMYEYQHNTIFSYATKENVDALIIMAGSIGCFTSKKVMKHFLKQYQGIPCILVAEKIKGYVSVGFDNYQGIKEGLEHLIEKAGCQKFGMIGGNSENTDSCERKRAFVETLEKHGIEVTDKMYVEGDSSRRCVEAYRKLLDDNPDIEAIFCVNDETALGLYEEMQRRGIHPGRDVCILGYDDTIMAAKMEPALSSVRADSRKLGEEAMRMAIQILQGETVESCVIPTRFIKRGSICRTREEERRSNRAKDFNVSFKDIFYRYCHEEMREQMEKLRASYWKLMESLSVKGDGEDNLEAYMEIMQCLDEFINAGGVEYADMDNLLNNFEEIYKELGEKGQSDGEKFQLRNLFSIIYKKIIRAMNRQLGNMKESKDQEGYSMKLFVQDMLQFERGRDQSFSTLLENLDWLQVKNAAIYMLADPVLHLFKEEYKAPEKLYLKAVLRKEKVTIVPAIKQEKRQAEIFENHQLDNEERHDWVLLPLFFKEMVYGVLLCDMTEEMYTNGEFLINQVSSAIKMITLLQANEIIQQQLEENVAALKVNNIELDTISKSDVLTGILNRRGFYSEAQNRIKESIQQDHKILIVYADMNNLKIINDRYGHEEGDYALKLIGRFLKEIVDKKGIAGRIGGDEYACAVEYEGDDEGEKLLQVLYQKFEEFNLQSNKPYNITVSAGACVVSKKQDFTLKDALLQADERLYEVKKYRKKDVAK